MIWNTDCILLENKLNRRKQAVKATVIFIEKKHFFIFIFVSTIFNEKAYLT